MAEIRKMTLPNGTTYDLRDSRVDSIISQGTRWVGVTTTAISDGSTTSTIVIGGEEHQAEEGDICSYDNMEFIWNGSLWQEFGSTGSLKALAFKDTASGTVAVPKTYSFTGTATNVTSTGSVTPEGSVSAPTISVATAGSTASVTPFGSAGSLPSCTLPTYTVSNDTLTITAGSFSAGSLPTAGTAVTVKTGDASYSASTPTFTGTATSISVTGSVTATGGVTTATTENKTVTVS